MISVALCTYNGERFLREQLDSIAGQSRLPDELIICDDVSSDRTIEILQAFKNEAAFPVHIYTNQSNLGSTRNFEKAIGLCSGDIIALCDQDDVWKPQKLERLLDVLLLHPEAGYVFSDAELVDERLQPLGGSLWDSHGFCGEVRKLFERGKQIPCFASRMFVTGATMAFRASVGKLAIPFPTEGPWIHDGWIALVASATGQPGIPVGEALIAYRQHSSQQLGAPELKEVGKKSLLGMFQELKRNQRALFSAWERNCLHVLQMRDILNRLKQTYPSATLDLNLRYFEDFETHYRNRKKILTSKGTERYRMVIREALSGRYGQFSQSWRSIFRDLFL
jgi:glycosyltransferase involved in cell wall biosynthesis